MEAADFDRLSPKRVAADIANFEGIDWGHPVCARLSPQARQLLDGMLRREPQQRISAAEALNSAFMRG